MSEPPGKVFDGPKHGSLPQSQRSKTTAKQSPARTTSGECSTDSSTPTPPQKSTGTSSMHYHHTQSATFPPLQSMKSAPHSRPHPTPLPRETTTSRGVYSKGFSHPMM